MNNHPSVTRRASCHLPLAGEETGHSGFTVLEILIVIAIMMVLMSMILVGLNSARSHSRDQDKVSNLQTIVVGLTQFYDACRMYPATLDPQINCPSLGTKSLADFIPNLATYNFNTTGSDYMYTGLTTALSDCTNFHIGVKLEGNASAFVSSKSSFELNAYNGEPTNILRQLSGCGGATDVIHGADTSVFDIKK